VLLLRAVYRRLDFEILARREFATRRYNFCADRDPLTLLRLPRSVVAYTGSRVSIDRQAGPDAVLHSWVGARLLRARRRRIERRKTAVCVYREKEQAQTFG